MLASWHFGRNAMVGARNLMNQRIAGSSYILMVTCFVIEQDPFTFYSAVPDQSSPHYAARPSFMLRDPQVIPENKHRHVELRKELQLFDFSRRKQVTTR